MFVFRLPAPSGPFQIQNNKCEKNVNTVKSPLHSPSHSHLHARKIFSTSGAFEHPCAMRGKISPLGHMICLNAALERANSGLERSPCRCLSLSLSPSPAPVTVRWGPLLSGRLAMVRAKSRGQVWDGFPWRRACESAGARQLRTAGAEPN